MKVLLVTKTTNFELHAHRVKNRVDRGKMRSNHIKNLENEFSQHQLCLKKIRQILHDEKIEFNEVSRSQVWPLPATSYDLVISVGGDGTLLSASHKMDEGGVLLGVKSSEMSVGYLCATDYNLVDTFIHDLKNLITRNLTTVVQRLKAKITPASDEKKFSWTQPILNDFLYTNANPASTTRYKIQVESNYETQKSSGVWISTAVGSTAGIFSAGGVTQLIDDKKFQYRVRELFKLHSKTQSLESGFFDPDQIIFEIENRCENAVLALDGQHGEITLEYGDRISFHRASSIQILFDKNKTRP